jgi:hypothetical protein
MSPPAVWVAFARQGAWKTWVIILQLALLFLLALACIQLARRPPDVVLVDSSGKSTYLSQSIAGEQLARFLAEQRQRPSDITIAHFSRMFLERFLAVNSSTIQAEWPEALAMMSGSLRARVEKEASAQKLVETYRAAQVQTEVVIEELQLVESLERAAHVRATVTRRKQLLGGGPVSIDRLTVDLVEQVVPRSPSHPDGLELVEYRNAVLPPSQEPTPNAH